jgi:hypothetical protein
LSNALTTNTALSKRELAESKLYPNINSPARAAVVMKKAQSYGLCPTTIADGLFFVGGKPALSAQLIATLVKRSGKYDFRVKLKTAKECQIEFFELIDGKRDSLGVESFTMEMATRAQLASGVNWKKFPEAMLWARCLTAGVRARCPDALGGNPVYSVEELKPDVEVDADGRPIIEAEVVERKPAASWSPSEIELLVTGAGGDLSSILAYHQVQSVEMLSDEQREEIAEAMRLKMEAS